MKTRDTQGWAQSRHWWMPAKRICKPTKPVAALCGRKRALPTLQEAWLLSKNKETVPRIPGSLLSSHQPMKGKFSETRKLYKERRPPQKPTACRSRSLLLKV